MSGNALPPRADRRQLQQIVAALTEGIIVVELDGTLAWADETALAMHGASSLAGLGGSAEGYTRRFAVAYLGSPELTAADTPIMRLLRNDVVDHAVTEVVRRSDHKRWVHEVRTMAMTDGEGRPDWFVIILDNETERYNAEERFERAFGANPAPAIIVRLSDLRFVKVNRGFLELTGYGQAGVIGRSMHEIDLLRGAERRELAMQRLHAWETIPQMEGCLALAGGGEKTVLLGGQPLEIGDSACMLFTFADLHPREQAHRALRQSEDRFAKAFHMAPGPMAMIALTGLRVLDVNAAFSAATGWRREEVVGRDVAGAGVWGEGERRDAVEHRIRRTGRVDGVDVEVRSKDGSLHDYLLSADTVEIDGERCVLCVMLDITERKQTETELLAAVQSAMQDTSWLGQRIVEKLTVLRRGKAAAPAPELSALPARAQEVLGLLAEGLADEQIAATLGISRNTLRNHIAVIYSRLGLHRRAAVVVWARERGLGTPTQAHGKGPKSRRRGGGARRTG